SARSGRLPDIPDVGRCTLQRQRRATYAERDGSIGHPAAGKKQASAKCFVGGPVVKTVNSDLARLRRYAPEGFDDSHAIVATVARPDGGPSMSPTKMAEPGTSEWHGGNWAQLVAHACQVASRQINGILKRTTL